MITVDYPSMDELEKILYEPEMFDRISEDTAPPLEDTKKIARQFYNRAYHGQWVGGYINGEIAALYWTEDSGEFHFMVAEPYRKRAKELADAFFAKHTDKVWARIPALYQDVLNFGKRYGFKETKLEKNAYLKNGVLHDVHWLEYEVKV